MIEHHKQSARSPEQPAPVEPENFQVAAAGRRRFLKGLGIGLPAVMTLRSGALLAASSSQCAVNANTVSNPDVAKFAKADDVGWLRNNKYNDKIYDRYTTNNPDITSPQAVFKSGSECYDPAGKTPPTFVPEEINVSKSEKRSVSCADYTVTDNESYFSLCYVENDGSIKTCSPNDIGNPVSLSCALNSLNLGV